MLDAQTISQNLAKLNLTLPQAAKPVASYVPTKQTGNQLYISGQVSADGNGFITGRLGQDLTLEQGQAAAQTCALSILAQIEQTAGVPLEKVQIIKLNVMVNSTPEFTDQPKVANGASDLFVSVLGDAGKHTRSAFGVAALPLNVAVEVDAVVEIIP